MFRTKRLINRSPFDQFSLNNMSTSVSKAASPIGFIGLGHMGSKMVANLKNDGYNLIIYDKNKATADKLAVDTGVTVGTVESIASKCSIVISMLPNDQVVSAISDSLLAHSAKGNLLTHISCSTISPSTSRSIAETYHKDKKSFIAAPVFARPDGLSKRQATWMIAGEANGKEIATELLQSMGKVVDFGDDVGSSNVVKLCGNFLIASSIESIGESMALAEKHGADRTKVMELLSSTIFDCLIYKGYGQRVSSRDHRPGGFSLDLGYKDVSLVSQAAKEANVPMPFLSTLLDRFTSARAKKRGHFDWSAIGLQAAEDAGINVTKDISRNKKDIADGNTY